MCYSLLCLESVSENTYTSEVKKILNLIALNFKVKLLMAYGSILPCHSLFNIAVTTLCLIKSQLVNF